MKCDQVKTFLPVLAAQGLEPEHATRLHRHVDGCVVCRTGFERARKLRAILRLKQHEQPPSFFYQNFVSEFHQRLYASAMQRSSWWDRIRDALDTGRRADIILRTSYAVTAFAAVLLGVYTSHLSVKSSLLREQALQQPPSRTVTAAASRQSALSHAPWSDVVWSSESSERKTVYVLDRVAYKPATHGSSFLAF